MSAFIPWLLGALIVILLVAFFVWPGLHKQKQQKPGPVSKTPGFKHETAGELCPLVTEPPAREPLPELPHAYGINRLVLLVRDPNWLYAYWEITATKQDEFEAAHGVGAWSNTRPVLRVYDVTGTHFNGHNANSFVDINLPDFTDNWHFDLAKPDRSFCVDLGRMFPDGKFITILRSNVVSTPRASLSNSLDEEWMWIEGLYRTIRYQMGVSSPVIIEDINQRMGALPLGISSPGRRENYH
ncbi:MAG: hypothetical protein VR69_11350 [Peptococcaceae bacterium BRH_c4b]|nr:MAG: hypothetical protein VR69_11350 [Peptococcaceae bacterium BRH_c4b]